MQTVRLLVIFALLAAVGYFAAREWRGTPAEAVIIDAAEGCDIAVGSCVTELPDGGELLFEITPRPIPLMQPLSVVARVSDSRLQPSRLDITGLNMEMGLNRTKLVLQQAGQWQGETILPICSQRRMHWQAALLLNGADRQFRLIYRFHTLRP